ncbi:MAG: alpha/beta hydrolase [Alphaproteobacteria bacterium]|nr:alpha/beta hydrolase [Alphaproteobacteria bacterium]MDP6518006.1 alpha/beta hydrolase [Alphaproteobacteria bacterium]
MTEITHRALATNSISLHVAEAGAGPLVLLLHGFPESWYSWRHQLPALAAAGWHAVAPDMRGYGRSDAPPEIAAYDQVTLAADIAGLIDALGAETAVVIGHDWGAPVAWHTALLHPERCRAVAGLSVPYRGRGDRSPLAQFKAFYQDRFFYILYFQTPGVAEAELEADIPGFLAKFLHGASGQAPRDALLTATKKKGDRLLDGVAMPRGLPTWLSQADLDYYAGEFTRTGLAAPLNWYRNFDRTWELTPQLAGATITQPALYVAGELDPVLRFSPGWREKLEAGCDDLRAVVLLEGCGHWIQQERPAETTRAILDFLAGLD